MLHCWLAVIGDDAFSSCALVAVTQAGRELCAERRQLSTQLVYGTAVFTSIQLIADDLQEALYFLPGQGDLVFFLFCCTVRLKMREVCKSNQLNKLILSMTVSTSTGVSEM